MSQVRVVLMWHQHQPIYVDPMTMQPTLPWVRLHAIKDYYGMAKLIERVDGMRATINLVPSLLEQLDAYADGRSVDMLQRIAFKKAEDLDEFEVRFALDKCFMANWDTMIKPVPRYNELLAMRDMTESTAGEAARFFRPQDLRDLQVLYELAWFHPILRREDPVASELVRKGSGFTEDEKIALFNRDREIVAGIVPLHRRLQEEGRIEVTSTPFYHPILPLLVDYSSLGECMPTTPLPPSWRPMADDARIHLERAISSHAERFGVRPRGMWPSEGSVSTDVARLFGELGIEWVATDEEILQESLGEGLGRYGEGLGRPDLLYRPYSLGPLKMIFRDHVLSDLIGFHYRFMEGRAGAEDMLSRLRAIGREWKDHEPPLVPIILDGENAWEGFPDQGELFLTSLYEGLVRDQGLVPLTGSEAVGATPARPLGRVYAGSWISHNFHIWAGDEEDRAAWEQVFRCRNALDDAGIAPDHPAREALRVAQGSDWYWWYGDQFSCLDAVEFDRIFREYVRKAYRLAELEAPADLDLPICRRQAEEVVPPRAFLSMEIDGQLADYFRWAPAGHIPAASVQSAMCESGSSGLLDKVLYGYDDNSLFVRVDFENVKALDDAGGLELVFCKPERGAITVPLMQRGPTPLEGTAQGRSAFGRVMEVQLPWADVPARPGEEVQFFLQRTKGAAALERAPRHGAARVRVPTPEEVREEWHV